MKLQRVVEAGMCIGCGLCQSIAGADRIRVVMTPEGRERPVALASLDRDTERRILAVCPGVVVNGPESDGGTAAFAHDPIWGQAGRMAIGYAGDPQVRHRASSGGALTALGIHLLDSGKVDFILHVAASRERPMRSERVLSFDRTEVIEASGSRYGPAAPLVDFCELLDRGQRFAFIGKPCDVAAVRNLARFDPRVVELVPYLLTLMCGGASELGLSWDLAAGFGLREDDVAVMRYRGHGNPGLTRIESRDGRVFERTYNEVWADEAGWRLQFRCKVCPDPIGEQADIVVSDVWPGGGPSGEDAGFNGFIARTRRGLDLLADAEASGHIILERPLEFPDFDRFQPHQVRKRRAIAARVAALWVTGAAYPRFRGLRLLHAMRQLGLPAALREFAGTAWRILRGKNRESRPVRKWALPDGTDPAADS